MKLRCTMSSSSLYFAIILLVFVVRIQCWSPTDQLSSTHVNNGALKLVLKGFIDEILREVQSELRLTLSQDIRTRLKTRYMDIQERLIHHPAFQERRLWVGKSKPIFDPDSVYIKMRQTKNRRHLAIPDESCQTLRLWELVNETIDINGRKVEVIQEQDALQYVFVYRCESSASPCSGINNNKYMSECEMRSGWTMMYHRIKDEPESDAIWGFVAIPHHCACKIIDKIPL